ncbi:MAG: serine hydrolase [Bacteroidetes bacterium]|jgi:beta-glucosidase-like glycosyl hydrolase/CubicO group peptidase (beta-lactamase class C family)|nr:serine hydrolase [Bacteroidota bacterium]
MRKLVYFISIFVFSLICTSFVLVQQPKEEKPPFWAMESKWVDSVFKTLSPDERIAQLFMVAAYSNKDAKHAKETRELIEKYNIGGLIFMQGGPVREAKLNNYYQTKAKTPLLISIDGEWGLAMRLDSTPQYPRQMTLGAIRNDSLIYQMGKQIASECKLMGIHVNFAPVADVNNNPENPVISMRSFGEDKYAVARKSYMYMAGMQDNGVMASGKHFPGHGDTDSDSHKTLPTIPHSIERLDSLELYPFKELFAKDLASVMVAHLNIPALDTTTNRASTLSKNVVTDLLKNKMQYKGLIFTDALNMKGASKYVAPGLMEAKALVAGNDVLLFSENVPLAITEIKKAIAAGEITQEEIDGRCKKILKAKFWCGLDKKQFVRNKTIYKDLNTVASEQLRTKLAEASVTVLHNHDNYLPIRKTDTLRIAEVSIGAEDPDVLFNSLSGYATTNHFGLSYKLKANDRDTLLARLKNYNLVVLSINKTNNKPAENFGLTPEALELIDLIITRNKTITVLFSNPYILGKIGGLENNLAVVEAYEYNRFSQKAVADVLFGAIGANAKLPVSSGIYRLNSGIETTPVRERIPLKEETGINKKKLQSIDSIALQGIKDECYPGCQIVAMRYGQVFYQKSFGKYTYEGKEKVTDSSVYDLASVTKITASALILMKMVEEKKVDPDKTLGTYLPGLKGTNKENIVIRQMLTHQAGFPAWIPFFLRTLTKTNEFKPGYYSTKKSDDFPTQVAENMYIRKGYTDSIYKRINEAELEKQGEYVYSDLGYYYIKKIAESQYDKPYNELLREKFYQPMNVQLSYQPLEVFNIKRIVPTENDLKFRKQLLRGYVHDQGAAMMGGVAGHAGLFGTAKDVAEVMQMLMNEGFYNGTQFISKEVVNAFTRECWFCPTNRRGLCFDKPEPTDTKESPVTHECSLQSFGHSGYTGTFAWADPENGLVYVFLSNRVYPDAEHNKLAKSGIRGKIHKLLYEAMAGTEVK